MYNVVTQITEAIMQGYTSNGSKPIPTRFANEQLNWLEEQAQNEGITVSDVIRRALFALGMPKPQRKRRRVHEYHK
jgi:hypothetical protein